MASFRPQTMSITNDSWQHRHHAPMRAENGGNGETRMYPWPFRIIGPHLNDLPGGE